ncbi:MAG: S1/P1 Nuclease, partial [Bacteroidales bacterium]|nr:S1/P1 Nuclease [Bacteroidales bacterium]
MKKTLSFIFALFFTVSAFGWGRVGHATVARIAENHLTPTTQKAIAEILDGHSIVEYASFADEYKNAAILQWDYGVDFKDSKRVGAFPHTFEADMNFQPFRGVNDDGRFVKNCISFVEDFSEELKDYKNMEDTARFVKLVMIVHWLGDMHCPEHIRYNPEDMTIGYYNVTYKGAPLRYHTFWDDQCITD